jgi:hypothetical protein
VLSFPPRTEHRKEIATPLIVKGLLFPDKENVMDASSLGVSEGGSIIPA